MRGIMIYIYKDKVARILWKKNKVIHQKIFAPQQMSYGIVALPGSYQNIRNARLKSIRSFD